MAGSLQNRRMKIREMEKTFESFEWLLKEDLVRLDNRARSMTSEMITAGARKDEISAYVQMQFQRLWREVLEEQAERYDNGGQSA